MPAKISHIKETKILHDYFSGKPQLKIAQGSGVSQAVVSRCATKFKKEAAAKGIVAASKERGIMEEVAALRSLSVELYKSKVSVEEAKSGVKMVKLFESFGVPPEGYKPLAKAVSKVKDPDYMMAAMNLANLEQTTEKSYTDIVSEYQQLGEEITERQQVTAALKEKQESQEKAIQELDLVKEKKEEEVAELQKEAEEKKAKIDANISQALAEAGLTQEKISELKPMADKMKGLGITGDKLETYLIDHQTLEEYGITWEKFKTVAGALAKAGEIDGDGLADKLAEFGTLDQAITSMKAEKTFLQPEVEKLGEDKIKLTAEVDGLLKSKGQSETEVGHLEGSKKALNDTIETLNVRRIHLEKHLAGLEGSVAKLETQKAALTEEIGQKEKQVAEMDEKLKTAGELDKELKEKGEQLQESNSKIAAAGQKYELFEAFLGLVTGRTEVEIEEFLKSAPVLVNEVKKGKYDPGFMVKTILNELSGGTLDQLACQYCGAEFIMLKRRQKAIHGGQLPGKVPMRCPDCGEVVKVVVKTPLSVTLKKVIVSKKPVLKKPEETTPGEKEQGENQDG